MRQLPTQPPAVPQPDPVAVAHNRITQAATLTELGSVWQSLPPAVQKLVATAKDARKAELTKLTPPPPPPPPDDELALDDLRERLTDEMTDRGFSVSGLYQEFGKRVGIDPAKRTPELTELTADQLTGLLEALEGRGQA